MEGDKGSGAGKRGATRIAAAATLVAGKLFLQAFGESLTGNAEHAGRDGLIAAGAEHRFDHKEVSGLVEGWQPLRADKEGRGGGSVAFHRGRGKAGEMLQRQGGAATAAHRIEDASPQLPYISRPGSGDQRREEFIGVPWRCTATERDCRGFDKVTKQQGNVVGAFPQGGNMGVVGLEAVEQVTTKTSGLDLFG